MKRRKDGRKDRRSGARWSKNFGPYGRTINLFEEPGGIYYISFRDPASGKEVRRSLGRIDRKLAIQQAQELSARVLLGLEHPSAVTLETGSQQYLREVTPHKSPGEQQHNRRALRARNRFLGRDRKPEEVTPRDIDRYVRVRSSGEIDANANRVRDPKKRRPVGKRTIERDLLRLGGRNHGRWSRRDGTTRVVARP